MDMYATEEKEGTTGNGARIKYQEKQEKSKKRGQAQLIQVHPPNQKGKRGQSLFL
jgi:hypothetical protein